MLTKKDRRHSGRKTTYSEADGYVTQITSYDDWTNYRDGFRNHICKKCNRLLPKDCKYDYCWRHRDNYKIYHETKLKVAKDYRIRNSKMKNKV